MFLAQTADDRSEKKKHLLISQQVISPFSRLQTVVTWFVTVVAAKMTDVDRLCREKGQVLETDQTGRMRTGTCQVTPGLWRRELGKR